MHVFSCSVRFNSVISCTATCQATLLMRFFREEYWSGLPFLSSGHLSDQGSNPGLPHCRHILYCLSTREWDMKMLRHFSCIQLFATLWTVAYQVSLSMGILQARILEWVAKPSSRGSSQPRIKPRSSTLQADSLPSKPSEKREEINYKQEWCFFNIYLFGCAWF